MDHPLRQKLERSIRLFPLEAEAVAAVPVTLRAFNRGDNIVRQGDRPKHCFTVTDGLAFRDKIVSGDRRQISAICVPGDMPDLQGLFLDELDHDISEAAIRLKVPGVSDGYRLPLPLTQGKISDMLGMSLVHVNRCMRTLRDDGLVAVRGRSLEILDWAGLKQFGEFDPSCLRLSPADRAGLPLD